MSRVGRQPIPVPSGVDITIDGSRVAVKGPKGELEGSFDPELSIELKDGEILVSRPTDQPRHRALQSGNNIELHVGYSNPVPFEAPRGVDLVVETPTLLHVRGIDKQEVGEIAAQIRRVRKPEPYKGKGIRYRGEQVRRKAGKAAGAGV